MRNTTIKGFLYAALSSSTFGLAPFFSISLLIAGFSSFEVLTYRWGIASLILAIAGIILGEQFRISRKDWQTVFILSLFRATTSFSLVIAYQNIASGVASTIHFMYPLAVAVTMMLFFKEKKSFSILFAVFISLIGATLLSTGEIDFEGGDTTTGLVAAAISIFSYGGYIIGVRKSRAVNIPSTALTCYVMGFGTLFYIIGGLTDGIRLATDSHTWLNILGLAIPATAVSNISLVKAIKHVGPTLTSIFGALEPLTAIVIGCCVFKESFTWSSTIGIALIVTAVIIVITRENSMGKVRK
jgi:hypothetical protein